MSLRIVVATVLTVIAMPALSGGATSSADPQWGGIDRKFICAGATIPPEHFIVEETRTPECAKRLGYWVALLDPAATFICDASVGALPRNLAIVAEMSTKRCVFSRNGPDTYLIKSPNPAGERVCITSYIPVGWVTTEETHAEQCLRPATGTNNYLIKEPNPAGERVCFSSSIPSGWVTTEETRTTQCRKSTGFDTKLIKIPNPAGEYVCLSSNIPTGWAITEQTRSKKCSYPTGTDTYLIKVPDPAGEWVCLSVPHPAGWTVVGYRHSEKCSGGGANSHLIKRL